MPATAEYTLRDQDRMKRARRYFEWQYRMAKAQLGRRVLEIGCGVGNFTDRLLDDREFVIAIDVEPACIAAHRTRFSGRPNLVSHCLDVLSPGVLGLRAEGPDSVACLNVLEHIADDRGALGRMYDVLPAGGRVVLMVPAFQSLYGPIDEYLGHHRRYNKRSLQRLAERAGFEIRDLRYMNALGFFGWWFNAHVSGRTAQSETQIAVFDALVVPVLSRLERLKAPPVGQSLFAVLQRRA
ncbi:MAG TPA: class I SAM-dependent methyltransferase [Verrucomicrobiae bacterium]|nr:class I SAM-dependent methyltransferase [Verrucomicrobiae bacterium]